MYTHGTCTHMGVIHVTVMVTYTCTCIVCISFGMYVYGVDAIHSMYTHIICMFFFGLFKQYGQTHLGWQDSWTMIWRELSPILTGNHFLMCGNYEESTQTEDIQRYSMIRKLVRLMCTLVALDCGSTLALQTPFNSVSRSVVFFTYPLVWGEGKELFVTRMKWLRIGLLQPAMHDWNKTVFGFTCITYSLQCGRELYHFLIIHCSYYFILIWELICPINVQWYSELPVFAGG